MSYQTTLFIGTFLTMVFIIISVIKTNMNIKYAVVWILWGVVMLTLSVYPRIIDKLSIFLGISIPVNTVFLIFIFLLYMMCFYLFSRISKLSNEIKNLTYITASLKKEMNDKDE